MSEYTLVIIITFVGFVGLAALLLVPVYRFLKREERAGRKWTRERLDPSDAPPGPSPNGTEADRDDA